jgi:hypothetical protein
MDTEDAPATAHMLIILDINYFRPVNENEDAEGKEISPPTGFGASKILGSRLSGQRLVCDVD